MNAFKKFDLTGKTAFVTGGGTGLGYYMARGLARSGAKVVIASRRENVLQDAAAKMTVEAEGNKVLYHCIDLADKRNVADSAEKVIALLGGGVDIFIGNAGLDVPEALESITDDSCDLMFQANVTANIMLTRAFVPHMRQNKWGRVMFSSSVMANLAAATEGLCTYTSAKGALNSFARTAAAELGHEGVTVNSLGLGLYQTALAEGVAAAQGMDEMIKILNSYISMTALGRIGDPEEVEGLIQLLASDAGSYITGSNIVIDGGLTNMVRPRIPES